MTLFKITIGQNQLIEIHGFNWDSANRAKTEKHGVRRHEIEDLFLDEVRIVVDGDHSQRELRWIAVGENQTGRGVFVAFTFREIQGCFFIRPISARYMHRKEQLYYERFQKEK